MNPPPLIFTHRDDPPAAGAEVFVARQRSIASDRRKIIADDPVLRVANDAAAERPSRADDLLAVPRDQHGAGLRPNRLERRFATRIALRAAAQDGGLRIDNAAAAGVPGARRAADAAHIIRRHVRQLEIDDVRHAFDIDHPRGDIGWRRARGADKLDKRRALQQTVR